ncbi:MAG TPA: DUF1289 domain-containing protein [Pedomonas sp.]|uniref:DUF1289 domain-containing protein n=1 Tax=Pedomonas sp. TaxID=2976421 RepID=UPI002F402C77
MRPNPASSGGVPSPCVNVCKLDDAGRHCVGCGRTIEEISRWSAMTAEERRDVLARLARKQSPTLGMGEKPI